MYVNRCTGADNIYHLKKRFIIKPNRKFPRIWFQLVLSLNKLKMLLNFLFSYYELSGNLTLRIYFDNRIILVEPLTEKKVNLLSRKSGQQPSSEYFQTSLQFSNFTSSKKKWNYKEKLNVWLTSLVTDKLTHCLQYMLSIWL